MKNMWIDDVGRMSNPSPASRLFRPSRPFIDAAVWLQRRSARTRPSNPRARSVRPARPYCFPCAADHLWPFNPRNFRRPATLPTVRACRARPSTSPSCSPPALQQGRRCSDRRTGCDLHCLRDGGRAPSCSRWSSARSVERCRFFFDELDTFAPRRVWERAAYVGFFHVGRRGDDAGGRYRSGRDQMRVAIGGRRRPSPSRSRCSRSVPAGTAPVKEPLILLAFLNIALGLLNLFPFYRSTATRSSSDCSGLTDRKARRGASCAGSESGGRPRGSGGSRPARQKPPIGTIAMTAGVTLFAQKRLMHRVAH